MSRERRSGRLAPAAIALAWLAVLLVATMTDRAAQPDAPLTNLDIVRMTADHVPTAEIVTAIEKAAKTDFDLDPDVVLELRRAGVAGEVIEAMRRAQPAGKPASPAAAPTGNGPLELSFEPAEATDDTDRTAVVMAQDRSGKPTSVAFFVYCVDPTHVPDLWWDQTPLSSNFPRHRLLWFHEATVPSEKRHGRRFIALDLPRSTTIEVPAGIHPLEFGVAARSGLGPWLPLARAEASLKTTPTAGNRVTLRVRTNRIGRDDRNGSAESPYSCDILRIDTLETKTPAP